ncbi:MAG: hypothetical protein JW781_04180 [Deltaproteobacteria bacterium]|nr:hypothetical protein [Candidatus Anaeroferrophillacea bacterium]
MTAAQQTDSYVYWRQIGIQAARQAVGMMRDQEGIESLLWSLSDDFIVLTNAGYAEIDGRGTMGALDGLSSYLKVSRGDNDLIEVHSDAAWPLWFAVYHKNSGFCAYLQVDPAAIDPQEDRWAALPETLFARQELARIDAAHLYANAAELSQKFNDKIFGGNEFRIVTIVNGKTAGAPLYAIRAFEFHDHYCMGVTSGLLMGRYIVEFFPLASGGKYFVQTVQPWCKEDALVVLLNTTPGKKGYAVSLATDDDVAGWPDWAVDGATRSMDAATTIIYRLNPASNRWDGQVLAFVWANTGCPNHGDSTINMVCNDLWYLANIDRPEDFIKVLREFELPAGVTPQSLARPGIDPILALDALAQ